MLRICPKLVVFTATKRDGKLRSMKKGGVSDETRKGMAAEWRD